MENKDSSESHDCNSIYKELDQLIQTINSSGTNGNEEDIIPIKVLTPEEDKKITLLLEANHPKSLEKNYLWQYNRPKVFKNHFEQRCEKFLSGEINISIKDFILIKLIHLIRDTYRKIRIIKGSILESPKIVDDKHSALLPDHAENLYNKVNQSNGSREMHTLADFLKHHTIIQAVQNEKIEYLLNKYDEIITLLRLTWNTEHKALALSEENMDYSDNKAVEKIVFLFQLGIIDFLRAKSPFNTSINKLAEVISAFTGIPRTTAQSYINAALSKDVVDKNNPLTEKNTTAVMQKLTKMGYLE